MTQSASEPIARSAAAVIIVPTHGAACVDSTNSLAEQVNMPANSAAWLPAKHAKLEVKPAPYTPPREHEIVVKNHAVAINPLDWIKQTAGDFVFSWIKYPFVLGSDLAGEVVEVGSGISRFKVGDRVLAHAVGTDPKRNSAAEGSFQDYTVVLGNMAAPIPDDLSYEQATVLPLGLSTAACGLFQKDFLALAYPTVPPKPNGKTVLIWGGSTSVGSNAIQLAVAAGYEIVTTASPRNFAYVQKLGASQVFDYHDKFVVRTVINALKGKTIAGALAVGADSAEACVAIVRASRGNKFVAMATYPVSFKAESGIIGVLANMRQFMWFSVTNAIKSRIGGVHTKFIFGSALINNEVSTVVYVDFLPKALAERCYLAAPQAQVVGTGLNSLQAALDQQRRGVSAAKVVVSFETASA